MGNSRTSNVIKNSGANLIYKASHIIMQFALRTAFIHLLGKEYTGISTLFTDILQVLSLMELGMGTAMTYALYKPLAENDSHRISALMTFYKKAYTIIGVLVFGVGMLFTPFLNYLVTDVPNIKESIHVIFIMYVLTSASSYFLVYKTTLLRANQEARIISFVDSVVLTIEGIFEIVALLIVKEYFAYLILHFLFTLIRNVILSNITQKKYKAYLTDKDAKLSKQETRHLFGDVFALGIYKISGVMINSTDSIVISAFIGTQDVAIIGNFTLIMNSIRTALEQVVESVKASVGNLAVTATKEKQREVFDQMNFISFWTACFCCTCFFVLLNPFVGNIWFDESYKISMWIVAVMTANFFIAVMVYPVEAFRTGNGLFIQGKYRPAIMAVLNIVLDILFVRFWGIFGVLFATTLSRLTTQVWFDPYLVYKHVFKMKPWIYYIKYVLQILVAVLCCGTAYFFANAIDIENVYLCFLYQMIIAVCVPNLILFVLFHNKKEFVSLKKVLLKILRRVKR